VRPPGRWLATLGALAAVAVVAFPLYWALVASLTPEAGLAARPHLVPSTLVLDHYRSLFTQHDFWRPLRNSLVVATTTTALCLVLGTLAAYALARLSFPGKSGILAAVLAASVFPQISFVSPLYLMLRALGLVDTYPALIVPYATFSLPLTVWLLTTHFRALPIELEEAARVDGATRTRVLVSVVLPLSLPALATAAILVFLYCWNEFLLALSFTLGPERWTVPVAIALFRGQFVVPWGDIVAGALVATLPVAGLVVVAQRWIVRGLTAGAVKG